MPDKNATVIRLACMLDPTIAKAASARPAAGNGAAGPENRISAFVRQAGLSEEAERTLRLMAPENLEEFLAGGEELSQKLSESKDKDAFVVQLACMLDPGVEKARAARAVQARTGRQAWPSGEAPRLRSRSRQRLRGAA